MSARDDYPLERIEHGVTYEMDPAQWKDMCDELDRLRLLAVQQDVVLRIRVADAKVGAWVREHPAGGMHQLEYARDYRRAALAAGDES